MLLILLLIFPIFITMNKKTQNNNQQLTNKIELFRQLVNNNTEYMDNLHSNPHKFSRVLKGSDRGKYISIKYTNELFKSALEIIELLQDIIQKNL